jgi:hypothetical protein
MPGSCPADRSRPHFDVFRQNMTLECLRNTLIEWGVYFLMIKAGRCNMEYRLSNPQRLTLPYLTLGTSICPKSVAKTDLTTLGNRRVRPRTSRV